MALPETIPLCVPDLTGRERAYLLECLDSGFVSSVGPFVSRFETAFAKWTGAKYAVACASGTAAIHLALQAVGVTAGDSVLVSDFTFIASANPVVYLGANPAFIDSEMNSWNMGPEALETALKEMASRNALPRAVVLVHIYGAPADIGPIADLCERYGVALVEDATEGLGASWSANYPHAGARGRQAGTVGRLGCFSFNGNKLITSGGGGMITTDDPALASWVKHMSCQAKLPGAGFVHDQVGYNYRMINLAAALGLAQLERIDTILAAKKQIADRYRAFARSRGMASQLCPPGSVGSDWMSSVAHEQRDELSTFLLERGIGCRPGWLPVSSLEPYRKSVTWGSANARALGMSVLCLPCSFNLTEVQQQWVCDSIDEFLNAPKR